MKSFNFIPLLLGLALTGFFAQSSFAQGADATLDGMHQKFNAKIYLLLANEGGHQDSYASPHKFELVFVDHLNNATITAGEGKMLFAGREINCSVHLAEPSYVKKGIKFAIRDRDRTVGAGEILGILE